MRIQSLEQLRLKQLSRVDETTNLEAMILTSSDYDLAAGEAYDVACFV